MPDVTEITWENCGDGWLARRNELHAGMIAAGSRWAWRAGDRSGLDDEATARREIEVYLSPPAAANAAGLPSWAAVPGDDGRPVRRNWSAAEYHADSRLSRSDLTMFEESARLYHATRRAKTITPPRGTAAMRFGTLAHMRVLEPEEFARRVWVCPANFNTRTNAGRAELADVRARGMIECDAEDAARIEGCADALMRHGVARQMIERCEREVTFTWREEVRLPDDVLSLDCRARIDLYVERSGRALIGDLKTTDDPSPQAFARSVASYRYHYQPPFYARPVRQLLGVEPSFRFIAVRSRPPHEVVVYKVEPDDIVAADKLVTRALQRLAQCVLTDTWSSPWDDASKMMSLHLPRWAMEEQP